MKKMLLAVTLLLTQFIFSQTAKSDLKMVTKYSSELQETRDLLSFQGLEYMKLKFTGTNLSDKGYRLSVKEIWDGIIVRDTVVIDSKTSDWEQFRKINDSTLIIRIASKHTAENKLKMTFYFPRFSITKEYDAINSNDYSLRNIADESQLEIATGKKFNLLAYILPYERTDGSKSWCDVGSSGKDIENWGKKFGIKHYLLFEMLID